MAKRQVFLFLSFLSLFVLFALFQNFKFIPDYNFKEMIGNLEVPTGFTSYVESQSSNDPIIFDQKRFLKDTIKNSPAYRAMKDFVEVSTDGTVAEPTAECMTGEGVDCGRQMASLEEDAPSYVQKVKLRANPRRQEASIRVNTLDNIDTNLNYCAEDSNLSLQFKKQMDPKSNVMLKMDSKDQSGSVLWSLSW